MAVAPLSVIERLSGLRLRHIEAVAVFLSLMLCGGSGALLARKQVTDRARKVYTPAHKPQNQWKRGLALATAQTADSLLLDSVIYRGFDKPSSADMESFIITNCSHRHLEGLCVEISYFTPGGELLHRREVERAVDIPAQESRKCDVRSFDRNHSFYYHLSNPGRSGAAAFTVKMHTKALYFTPAR